MAHRKSPTRAAKQRRIAHFLAQALRMRPENPS